MKMRITVDGTAYEVEVEVLEGDHGGAPITAARQAPIPGPTTPASAGPAAPLPPRAAPAAGPGATGGG